MKLFEREYARAGSRRMREIVACGILVVSFAAVAATPRSAGFTMRFDDNKATSTWYAVAGIFEAKGLPVSLSVISSLVSRDQAACLRDLSRRGHEIMDHTAQHAVYQLRYPAGMEDEFARSAAAPFAAESDRGSRVVYCKAELDFSHRDNRHVRGSIRDGKFLPAGPDKRIFRGSVIRFGAGPETYAGRPLPEGGCALVDFWGRPAKTKPADAADVDALILAMAAVQPSDDLLRAQARLSRANFKRMGLPPPTVWIQPGGWEMSVSWERLARIYGREFGYVGADARVDADRSVVLSATEDDPKASGPWTMAHGDAFFDAGPQITVGKALAPVVREIGRKRSYIHLSHLWTSQLPGGEKEMYARLREFAEALSTNRVPTVTHTELARRTFGL